MSLINCDLLQDFNEREKIEEGERNLHDKHLLSILLAPIYNLEHVYAGEHLSRLGRSMAGIERKSNPKKKSSAEALILQDKNPRYHYLSFPDSIGLPPSIIDFKHYFTIDPESVNEVIGKHFVCSVGELFREDVSQRFAAFLSRIGLPPI